MAMGPAKGWGRSAARSRIPNPPPSADRPGARPATGASEYPPPPPRPPQSRLDPPRAALTASGRAGGPRAAVAGGKGGEGCAWPPAPPPPPPAAGGAPPPPGGGGGGGGRGRHQLVNCPKFLEQPGDAAVFGQVDAVGGGDARQARHRHDLAAHRDDELGAGRQPDLAHREDMVVGRALGVGFGGKAVLGLGNAHPEIAEPGLLQLVEAAVERRLAND